MKFFIWIAKAAAFVAALSIIGFFGFFIWIMRGTEAEPQISQRDQIHAQARQICADRITDRLKDPASAKWDMSSGNWYATWPAATEGETVTVAPEFRAKNSFGALILSRWICTLKTEGADLILVSLREI